jgi:hypothetical protein
MGGRLTLLAAIVELWVDALTVVVVLATLLKLFEALSTIPSAAEECGSGE